METPNLTPVKTNSPYLPSFPSLRSRNLATLYNYGKDKSPKGSIDTKIAHLCHLINRHDEYVTTSSCSGRVALFDPGVDDCHDGTAENGIKIKSTKLSGKGRGQWRFVTHDILHDLGTQLVDVVEETRHERLQLDSTGSTILTLKYEPPLLHIAAASLSAGTKMLRLFKSVCRESGLVVTDERVTVEVRTTGTAICVPVFLTSCNATNGNINDQKLLQLSPSTDYLMDLAKIMNERMVQNEVLLKRLYNTVKEELFDNVPINCDENHLYEVELQPLPSLNLWKAAAVALSCSDSCQDLNVLSFGGHGIGPSNNTTCQRWDKVFCLKRRNYVWSDSWNDVKLLPPNDNNNRANLNTNTGRFEVELVESLGRREGHSACVLPRLHLLNQPDVVVIFGGRAGGPLLPTNDLFLFTTQTKDDHDDVVGCIAKPCDVRGSPPAARFGHSMTVLPNVYGYQNVEGEALAVLAGGMGVDGDKNHVLSSVYILSRCKSNNSEVHHLIWERISDMQVPRCYHAAIVAPYERNKSTVFVFGGVSQSDEPFGETMATKTSTHFEDLVYRENDITVDYIKEDNFPSMIGGTGILLETDKSSNQSTLVAVGGTESCIQTSPSEIFQIFQCKVEGKSVKLIQSKINVVQNKDNVGCDKDLNLGVCVHHCLISLPKSKEDCHSSLAPSAIIIGGGVPSFSFGQSYAK